MAGGETVYASGESLDCCRWQETGTHAFHHVERNVGVGFSYRVSPILGSAGNQLKWFLDL
jgi:hypothetical protein